MCTMLFVSPAAESSDDTFEALSNGAPIAVEGNQEYETYTLVQWDEGTVVDATRASWKQYGYAKDWLNAAADAKNVHPIQLGIDWNGCSPNRVDWYNSKGRNVDGKPFPVPGPALTFCGGVVDGGQETMNCSWWQSKSANGGAVTFNVLDGVLDGVRVHNTGDGIQPFRGNNFTYKNCWFSWVRDDMIENDAYAQGMIDDCLFDGVYCFYSCVNHGSGYANDQGGNVVAMAVGGGPNGTVTIQNCIIYLQNMPLAGYQERNGYPRSSWGFGNFWKGMDERSPKVQLLNNIIMVDKPGPGCGANRYSLADPKITRSEGNVAIWLGAKGSAPGGFKHMSGAEGKQYYENAKAEWIKNHPYVGRLEWAGDPPGEKFTVPGTGVDRIPGLASAQELFVRYTATPEGFRFNLPHAGAATMSLLDTRGRCVWTCPTGTMAAGGHSIRFDQGSSRGRIKPASGLYLLRIRLNGRERTDYHVKLRIGHGD